MSKPTKEIFKIQIPLFGEPKALIYNKDKSFLGFIPVTAEVGKVMCDEFKKFVFGKRLESGIVEIEGVAPWQEW